MVIEDGLFWNVNLDDGYAQLLLKKLHDPTIRK